MSETLTMIGGIDLHTHLREPSNNTSETIESGTRAALLGGWVLLNDMPNNPGMPVWYLHRLEEKFRIANNTAFLPIGFYMGGQPEEDNVGEIAKMAPYAIAMKGYGDPTTGNDNTYEAEQFGGIITEYHRVAPKKPYMFHAGKHNLEDMIGLVAVDNDHPLHVCHVNSTEQVRLVNKYQDKGYKVTNAVTIHHLLKSSFDIHTQGVFAEVMPKLADQDEAERLMGMLAKGKIDAIETDFAPHGQEAKYHAEHEGGHCYGLPGIEHAIPLLLYQAIKRERIELNVLERALYDKPKEILGVRFANKPQVTWDMSGGAYRIGEDDVQAQCDWTPYMGMLALGKLQLVKVGRHVLVEEGEIVNRAPQVIRGSEDIVYQEAA